MWTCPVTHVCLMLSRRTVWVGVMTACVRKNGDNRRMFHKYFFKIITLKVLCIFGPDKLNMHQPERRGVLFCLIKAHCRRSVCMLYENINHVKSYPELATSILNRQLIWTCHVDVFK